MLFDVGGIEDRSMMELMIVYIDANFWVQATMLDRYGVTCFRHVIETSSLRKSSKPVSTRQCLMTVTFTFKKLELESSL